MGCQIMCKCEQGTCPVLPMTKKQYMDTYAQMKISADPKQRELATDIIGLRLHPIFCPKRQELMLVRHP
jgi:hypothetical protein